MKYDDASWHYGGNFPKGLPNSAGATHIAMFVAWAMLNGLAGELHTDEFPDDLAKLRHREVTPGGWFLNACDGKLTDEDLSEEGNRFAASYYADQSGLLTSPGSYLADYEAGLLPRQGPFGGSASLYHVPDSWETYAIIDPVIKARYADWCRRRSS